MKMFIIIAVVCVILYFIYKNKNENNSQTCTEIPDGTFCETTDAINAIIKFRKEVPLFADSGFQVLLIQTDSNRIRYSKEKREYLHIKFYIYEPLDYYSNIVEKIKNQYFAEFEIKKEDSNSFTIEFFTNWPYVYGENTLIPNLFRELTSKFSEYAWCNSEDMISVDFNAKKS